MSADPYSETLTEALASLGYTHEKQRGHAHGMYRRRILRDDVEVSWLDAAEGWAFVAELRGGAPEADALRLVGR